MRGDHRDARSRPLSFIVPETLPRSPSRRNRTGVPWLCYPFSARSQPSRHRSSWRRCHRCASGRRPRPSPSRWCVPQSDEWVPGVRRVPVVLCLTLPGWPLAPSARVQRARATRFGTTAVTRVPSHRDAHLVPTGPRNDGPGSLQGSRRHGRGVNAQPPDGPGTVRSLGPFGLAKKSCPNPSGKYASLNALPGKVSQTMLCASHR